MPPGHRGRGPIGTEGRHLWRAAAVALTLIAVAAPVGAENPSATAPESAGATDAPAMTPVPTADDGAPAMTPAPAEAADTPAMTPAPAPAGDAGTATVARAPGGGPKPPKEPVGPPQPGPDAAAIRLLLDAAGLKGFRVLDPAQVAVDWPEATYMWANDRSAERPRDLVYGMMIERPVAGQKDFDRDVRRIVIKWSADCDGKSGVTMGIRETLANGRYARRAGYKCADSDGVLLVRGFFVGGENAIVGVVHFFTPAGQARGEAADVAMYRTFLAIMND